jgi:hypothetical protein
VQSDALTQFDGQLLDGLEFCARVYALFESIRSSPDGASRLRRLPTRVEKRLVEELLPLCTYVQASYRPGRYISVRWIDGPQTYDAKIEQRGAYVCENNYPPNAFVEVTSARHPNEFLSRELLDTEGFAFGLDGLRRRADRSIESVPVGYSNRDFVEKFAGFVLDQVAKKEEKRYPEHTTLLVQCILNLPYLPDEWSDLVGRIKLGLPSSQFAEIYLYDPLGRYSHTIFPKQEAINGAGPV